MRKRKVELRRPEILDSSLCEGRSASLVRRDIRRGEVLRARHTVAPCGGLRKLKLEQLAFELLGLVQIQEVWLAGAFAIDGDKCTRKRFKEYAHRLGQVCNGNLFHGLGLLLIKLDVVESNEVVSGEHEVEVIRYDKAHRLDRLGLGELEAHLFRLLLLQKE